MTVSKLNYIKQNGILRGIAYVFSSFKCVFVNKRSLGKCGTNVIIVAPSKMIGRSNIFIGDNIGIGGKSWISAVNAKFICKGNCSIAEGLTVHTGNHARVLGKFVSQINESNKPQGYDNDVIIEEDVWIGSNVTILSGVTIGRGCTVAAGSVVSKSIPPYCICGGVPAKVIKHYWKVDEILEHESKLYPVSRRYTREQLKEFIKD